MNKLMMVASAAFAVVAGAAFADGPALPTDRPDGAIDAVSGENGLSWSGAADAWKVGDDTVIVFTDTASAGRFTVNAGKTATARVLAVGGGGPGGYTGSAGMSGGGGGAGGMLEEPARAFVSGSYTIAVGKGGVPVQDRAFLNNNGEDSTISKGDNVLVRAYGGGGGGNSHSGSTYDARAADYDDQKVLIRRRYDEALLDSACGRCGGSGGGGACFRTAHWGNGAWGGTNVVGQGSFGGDVRGIDANAEFYQQGGGGGGAGGPGGSCPDKGVPGGGVGGEGRSSDITGIDVVYAGGGAGGAYSEWGSTNVLGGVGGGGSSHSDTYFDKGLSADDGVDTLGGGGAGAACHGTSKQFAASNVGKGGSGVVVIRVTKVEDVESAAQIGDTVYKTLADAFAAVKGQTIITLLTSVNEDIVFAPQALEDSPDASLPYVSIDLGGCDLGGSLIVTNASLGVSGGTVSAAITISGQGGESSGLFPGNARFVGDAQVCLTDAAQLFDGNGWSFDVEGDAIVIGPFSAITFNSGKIHAGGSAVVMAGGTVEINGGLFTNDDGADVDLIREAGEANCKISGGVFSETVAEANIQGKEWNEFTDKDGNTRYCVKDPVEDANYTVINTATGEATDYVFSDWAAAKAVIGAGGTADAFMVVQFEGIKFSQDNVAAAGEWPKYRLFNGDNPQYVRLEFLGCTFDFTNNEHGEGYGIYLQGADAMGVELLFEDCQCSDLPYVQNNTGSLSAVDGTFINCKFGEDAYLYAGSNWGNVTVQGCEFLNGLLRFGPVANLWKDTWGNLRRYAFTGNTVVFNRDEIYPEMRILNGNNCTAFSFGDCTFKVRTGDAVEVMDTLVDVVDEDGATTQAPYTVYEKELEEGEFAVFSVRFHAATVDIKRGEDTELSAKAIIGQNGLWDGEEEIPWPEEAVYRDEGCTDEYDKTEPITEDLELYMKAAAEDWPDPATVDENTPASDVLGFGGPLQNASLKALSAWAKGWGGVDFANRADIILDAFLLNCPNSPEAVEEAKAEFKIVSITFKDGVWEVKANEEGTYGKYNGKAVKKRYSDVVCETEADDGNFFRAYLVVDEVVK